MRRRDLALLGVLVLTALRPGALAAQQPSPDTLTAAQVVSRVLENHPAIQSATDQVAAARARVGQSRSAYYPQLDASGLYSRIGPVPSIELPGDGSFDLYPRNNFNVGLELRQTVYDFGVRSTQERLARSGEAAAGDNLELLTSGLAYRALDDFYTILYLQGALAVQDDQIESLNQHLAVTSEKERTGSATQFDVLTTRVRVATATSRRIDIANALERATIELRGLMNSPQDEAIQFRGDFQIEQSRLDIDSLTALALAQRPEMAVAREGESSAEIQRRIATLGQRPTLDFDFIFGVANGYIPNLNDATANFVAALSMKMPVFNGFLTKRQVEETDAELAAARARTQDVSRRIITQVRQAVADARASRAKLESADLQVRQAEEAMEMARVRYRAGVITNLDVLVAETSLAQARLMQLEARYHVVTSSYALQRAVGARIW